MSNTHIYLSIKDAELAAKNAELDRLRAELATKDAELATKKRELEGQVLLFQDAMNENEALRARIVELNDNIALRARIAGLRDALELAMAEIDKHQAATGDTLRGNPRNHVSFPPTLDKIRAALNPKP